MLHLGHCHFVGSNSFRPANHIGSNSAVSKLALKGGVSSPMRAGGVYPGIVHERFMWIEHEAVACKQAELPADTPRVDFSIALLASHSVVVVAAINVESVPRRWIGVKLS